ncbi:fap1 adhesin isoform X2 [Linepithema humile]|uniref:fap1 adhesin isoform X2 n=1 Tax=Linepithema humile TaxID=83485 RepID=UPI00351E8859
MSEDFKMGLFGSKDRNQEQKEKSSKDNSPAQYAPYGVDSDTETYDTEALSMMDINDIIGVQSGEQVGDSTLESEIAALSQIITDSKIESISQSNPKPETEQSLSKALNPTSDTICVTNTNDIEVSSAESSIVSEKCTGENISSTEMDPVVKYDETCDVNTDKIVDDTSTVCASKLSSNDKSQIEINSLTTILDDTSQENVQNKQETNTVSSMEIEKDIVEKIEAQSSTETVESEKESKNSAKSMVTVGGISKSLQLIGEAYNSEDSEETDMNDGDSLKETPISAVHHEKDNSEETDELEQAAKILLQLDDIASGQTISEESSVKVENVIDNQLDLNKKVESEDSSQHKTLQQTLEKQENIDDCVLKENIDNEISSSTYEQSENNTDKAETTEETSLVCQSSIETCKETTDTLVDTIENIEESRKDEVQNIELDSRVLSTHVPETEKESSSATSNELLDNCSLDNEKELVQNVPESKDTDASVESANETKDSMLIETSDKKSNMAEVTSKNNDSQEANMTIESCQTTQEIVSIVDKINDSQETAVTTSDNQDDMSVEETSDLKNVSIVQTTPDTSNEELVLDKDTSVHEHTDEERNIKNDITSISSHLLSEESSDLCSTDLITQTDTNSTSIDVNNLVETAIHAEDIFTEALESLIPIEHDESIKQLPTVSEKSANEINDIAPSQLEDSILISNEDSNKTIENINEPLLETEKTENAELKISEAASSLKEDENKTLLIQNKPQQELDRSESCVQNEEINLCAMKDDDAASSLHNIAEKEEVEENIAEISSNKTEIKEIEKASSLKEEEVAEIEKNIAEDDKTQEIVPEPKVQQSDIQATNVQDTQHDENVKPCDETAGTKTESEDSIDVNVTPIVEEKNVKTIIEESADVNLKDVQSSIISTIDTSLLHENSNERADTEQSTKKLSDDSESIDTAEQTIDALEGLLTLIPDSENSSLKDMKVEDKAPMEETASKDVDMDLLLDQANQGEATIAQNTDYITSVITSCLTNRDNETSKTDINAPTDDKTTEDSEALTMNKNISAEPLNETTVDDERIEEALGTDGDLQQNDLDVDFEDNRLEPIGELEENEAKLELPQDILLESVMARENVSRCTSSVIENSQSSSEISELESAVKFLQESEEQTIDSPLVLSPKMVESVVEDITKQANEELYVPVDDEVESELANLRDAAAADSISISEAEIISEAAKLEKEREIAVQMQNVSSADVKDVEISKEIKPSEETEDRTFSKTLSDTATVVGSSLNVQVTDRMHVEKEAAFEIRPLSSEGILKACERIPRTSILEERLKEPPKIEIPVPDSAKMLESSISPNDSLLMPKDARAVAYSRMLESPKSAEKTESKGPDTPRRDEKHSDFENVGSPRIILKIAKSAIADCSEPRSPKSPKIRSATNSPNPEDSPGQKLGKIKLKLSKGGHPSIISNEYAEEINQWHTSDNAPSLSPIGMKIKLSKSGDASIVSAEKHENIDDSKEAKYKIEEPKRTDSPIGMKIKLSKSGDASIISDSKQQDSSKEAFTKHKEKLEISQGSPKRTESPIGMKFKLSKTGDASIIQTDKPESSEEHKEAPKRTDSPIGMKIKLSKTGDASIVSPDIPEDTKESSKAKEKQDYPEPPKRTESPIGMKIKLSKCKGGASIVPVDNTEDTRDKLEVPEPPKRTESPLGMKFKLSKSGDASIIHSEVTDDVKDTRCKEKSEMTQDTMKTSESSGIKIKMIKTGETTSSTLMDMIEEQDTLQASESTAAIPKIKVSKSGDASDKTESAEDSKPREGQAEAKRTESPLGMKIKLSKSGDASIVQSEATAEDHQSKATRMSDAEHSKGGDSSIGMKIKLFKTGDASVMDTPSSSSEKKDKQQRRREATDSPLEMKIKLSKTGHPTIVTCDTHGESSAHKGKDVAVLDSILSFPHRYMEQTTVPKEPGLKMLKSGHHSSILQSNRAELTIEPVQSRKQSAENTQQQIDISPKRKDVTISPIESKKSKLEAQLSQILPEVTIQPVVCRDQKQQQQQQLLFDPNTNLISRQQMNVINQEISITQVRPSDVGEKLKDLLSKNTINSPGGSSDCEIIEHRPELIIVNENSNSSQDVVIIEEVTPKRSIADIKVPKKRGRPRRNPMVVQQQLVQQSTAQMLIPRDPLALDEVQQVPPQQLEHRENERPKRTCRSQKSYAPPKRGRGRGRGKRKMDNVEPLVAKKPRIDQDLSAIEASTMAVITIDETTPIQQDSLRKSSELYKALKQPPMDCKIEKHILSRKEAGKKDLKVSKSEIMMQLESARSSCVQEDLSKASTSQISADSKADQHKKPAIEIVSEKMQKAAGKQHAENKGMNKVSDGSRISEIKEIPVPPGHSNWLTPTSKKQADTTAIRGETVSTVQVIDEETRMSAESGSRSQTPARNISAPASETIINEESQGSVLSTATTESEKVKVKNRRMEINFDPDEGPFTVDKIAEYEWPLDRKGETFMIQEQISQYLGVKSFKRLTAVCSSEVLDVMCSDFPDQYEEYRKHMREKQVKEHSKKQKELSAAANAERNRIDLAEMAVQSAMSWNISLNKARKENRKCCLDLQTFTIHVPKKQQKVDPEHKVGHYPVALIPGQYTDYYREYTPAELRYYPLNTVLYGPTRPNERKFDSQSEGSQSDSDSESSSDDSSSSSSEGTQDTEGSQSTMDDVDMDISNSKDDVKLKCKMCLKILNKHNKSEILIQCGTCNGNVHPSCIDLTLDMVPHIQSYAWQCTDCKTCAQCHDPADEDKMLFCDMCDRGYHIYCVGLRRVPQGRWHCQECAVCANCGSREPGGANSDRNSVALWQHEYKKGEKNTRVYVSTLCVPCSKLWRKGRYCPHCSRCHTSQRLDLEANLVHCSACDKYLHLECVETKGLAVDKKNYLCDFCTPSTRHQMTKPLVSKVLKT